jgi:hypothetical protein
MFAPSAAEVHRARAVEQRHESGVKGDATSSSVHGSSLGGRSPNARYVNVPDVPMAPAKHDLP